MAVVFSYIRFSHKRQEQGDSVRRQKAMGKAWLDRHPEHTLDQTLRLTDLGVSAFRGANLDAEKGDLGKFIALVRQGTIPQGSILMIERLDRFSRQAPRKAYRVFCELVELGLTIQTLDPEQTIDTGNIDDMATILPVIIYMQLAYEQSKEKQQRIGQAWKSKRAEARKGEACSTLCPTWLYYDEQSEGFKVKPEGRQALRYIFTQTANGVGQKQITYYLNKHFAPLGRGKLWHCSFVGWVIKNRQVLGEYQTCILSEGKRIPDGLPIKDYFPRVIPDDLFYRANGIMDKHRKQTGPTADFVNLFVGRVYGIDGYVAQIKSDRAKRVRSKPYVRRAFQSVGHRVGKPDACPFSVPYEPIEAMILTAISEIKPSDLMTKQSKGNDLLPMVAQLQGIERRLGELEQALTDPRNTLPEVIKAFRELEAKRDRLQRVMEQKKQVKKTKPLEQFKSITALLDARSPTERHNLRLKLRGLIQTLVEKITLHPYKEGGRVGARVVVEMKAGDLRLVLDSKDYIGQAIATHDIAHLEARGDKAVKVVVQ